MNQFFPEIQKGLGFGFMRLPRIGEQLDLERCCGLVDLYLEAGFNYFDTAHPYYQGKSEEAIRHCLTSRYPRERFVLANKLSDPYFSTAEEVLPLFQLQLELCGDPTSSFGLGSVTFTAKTANGFLAMDGNMREVVLWAADGTWLGAVEDSDLFGTYYPWFATGDVMDDGSILVVMTEDRADGSAMEAIAFKLSIS